MGPPPCSPTGSLWREKLHLQSQWFVPSFISVRVPNKEPFHEKQGKYLVTVHRAPRGQKAYIQWGAAWFPKGVIYNTAIYTSEQTCLSVFELGKPPKNLCVLPTFYCSNATFSILKVFVAFLPSLKQNVMQTHSLFKSAIFYLCQNCKWMNTDMI